MANRDQLRRSRSDTRRINWNSVVFNISVWIVLILLLAPIVLVVFSSFSGKSHLSWPFTDLTFRWYGEVLRRSLWVKAFVNSLIIAVLATVMSLAIATPAAFALSRRKHKESGFIRSFISWL